MGTSFGFVALQDFDGLRADDVQSIDFLADFTVPDAAFFQLFRAEPLIAGWRAQYKADAALPSGVSQQHGFRRQHIQGDGIVAAFAAACRAGVSVCSGRQHPHILHQEGSQGFGLLATNISNVFHVAFTGTLPAGHKSH